MDKASILKDPTTISVSLIVIIGFIFLLSSRKRLRMFFRFVPPITLTYFIPMALTSFGVFPAESSAYSWITQNLLPASLILLIVATDIPAIMRLGPKALAMMLAGSLGIIVGGPVALLIFGRWLPPESWKGFGALAGSWIGGSVNMMAVAEGLHTPPELLAPLIVVDTVVGYTWFGILIYLSTFQDSLDRWLRADRSTIEELNAKIERETKEKSRPIALKDLAYILALAFGLGRLCLWVGELLPELGKVIGPFTWTIIISSAVASILSFTRLRRLEDAGASRIGYMGIYLVLASIGARANVRGVLDTPVFFAAGVVWIIIHASILIVAAKLLRAPSFLVATGSMANIGGTSTGPITASVYQPALAPVGLLLAVFGMIIGTYAALICAQICAMVSGV